MVIEFPEFDRLLTNTCTTKKLEESSTAKGQRKVDFVNVETGIACFLSELNGTRDATILGKIPDATHKLFIGPDHTVEVNYQIVIGIDKYVVRHVIFPDELVDFENSHHHMELILEKKKA